MLLVRFPQSKGLLFARTSLEKEMAPNSNALSWKIPWMEESGRLLSIRLQRVGHAWVTSLSFLGIKKKIQGTEQMGSEAWLVSTGWYLLSTSVCLSVSCVWCWCLSPRVVKRLNAIMNLKVLDNTWTSCSGERQEVTGTGEGVFLLP